MSDPQRRREDAAIFAQEMAGSLRDSYRLGGWGSLASAVSLPVVVGVLGRAAGASNTVVYAWVVVDAITSLTVGGFLLRSLSSWPWSDFDRRKRNLMVGLASVGSVNAMGLLLPPSRPGGALNTMMFALLVLYSGMLAANSLVGFGIRHLFTAFALPVAVTAFAACLRSGGVVGWVLAFGCVVFTGVTFGINAMTGTAFRTAARLQAANKRLVQDLEVANRELAQRALLDELTGIPNRAGLWNALRSGPTVDRTILFLDLDGFKPINDAHGHEVGDEVLQVVAQRLRAHVREGEIVARVGGDEFVVIVDGVDHDDPDGLAARLARSIAEPIHALGRTVGVTASIGAAHLTDGSPEEALNEADRRMYEAKREVVSADHRETANT